MRRLRRIAWCLGPRGRYARRVLRRAEADHFALAADRLFDQVRGAA